MKTDLDTDDPRAFVLEIREQLEVFIDEHRAMLAGCLDGITEDQARAQVVPSNTTLLGLVKHATFVEQVWFSQAVTGLSRAELGIVDGPTESFTLEPLDSIASVLSEFRFACEQSRAAVSNLSLDEELVGNRRGPLPLRWVLLHVLRELAQHCGHADILREQILTDSDAPAE